MAIWGNKGILIKHSELPIFNGRQVKSIYAEYENSRYEGGWYVADILYYKVYVEKLYNEKNTPVFKLKELPKDFHPFFNKVTNKGKRVFVTNIWFRQNCSGHGGFTDSSIDLGGWEINATTGSLSLTRNEPFLEKDEYSYAINTTSDVGKAMLNILGKTYEVEEIEFAECGYNMVEGSLDFATKYPYEHTPIRWIDGCAYPDEKLPSWRWLHGMPYRLPNGVTDKKYIRVWDEDLKRHLFLEKVEEVYEGEEGLISVDFPYKHHDLYGNEGNAYCRITRYNETYNYVFQTYNVTGILKTSKEPVIYSMFRNNTELKKNLRGNHNDFYRITKISYSITNENKDQSIY